MANREFCQLSKVYDNQNVGGWMESSKLDGFRVIWDGGVSRGVPKDEVPYANTAKDFRYKEAQIATGLWTRYGNVVHAPSWFLDFLPKAIILDGEMWSPALSRQEIRSICSKINPITSEWMRVSLYVITRLSPVSWLEPGLINNPNFPNKYIGNDALDWWLSHGGKMLEPNSNIAIYKHLLHQQQFWNLDVLRLVKQTVMPFSLSLAREHLSIRLIEEMNRPRGEGLILTNPNSFNSMVRVKDSLKVKPRDDSEGVVVGYISGREGKLRGMLGALILDWEGKRLELSGFTEAERVLNESSWAYSNIGKELPDDIYAINFPIGSRVTFSYRGLTDDGIPNEAVYFRGRD